MKKTLLLSAVLTVGSVAASAQEYFWTGTGDYIPVENIDSITYEDFDPKTEMLPAYMAKDKNISIFNEALALTKIDDLLCDWIDDSYSVGKDSTRWEYDVLVIHTGNEYDNVAYPKQRRRNFTAFVEPDEVYAKYGINNIDDLKAYAKKIYDEVYPEDADITDPTDRRNSLNRFVAYHFLNRKATYYTLTAVDGPNSTLAKNWDRTVWDIADWYETMMPYSIMKFSYPDGTESGLYINRRGVMSSPDYRGVKIRGAKVEMGPSSNSSGSMNGFCYYIDDIIHYGKVTQQEVLDERMRIDATTLSPDFMTSGARGHYTRSNYEGGKYGTYDATPNASNKQLCLGFKTGFIENFEFYTENKGRPHLHVRPRTLSFWSYQGDEVIVKGIYDVTVKLPPVPAGTYELRLGTTTGVSSRGIVQFYLDGQSCGEPVDFRSYGSTSLIGWKNEDEILISYNDYEKNFNAYDEYLKSEGINVNDLSYQEQRELQNYVRSNVALQDSLMDVYLAAYDHESSDSLKLVNFDKEFRSRGWMKGPASYYYATSEAGGTKSGSFRNLAGTLRRIVCTFESDGKTDHYLRMEQTLYSVDSELSFDYIELCPKSVYDNELYPEDIY